jgi:site-specific DNA recombinase
MIRAAVYLRISKTDEDETPRRHRADCLTLCQRQGWEVADIYEDPDLSAWDRKLVRPEYERLTEDVKSGSIDVVVAWHIDRLSRNLRVFVDLMDALEDKKAFIVTATDGVDTRTSAGAFIASVLVAHARMASDDASRRLRSKHAELAREGKKAGWGRRSFGYEFKRETKEVEVIEDEAQLIRDAMRRVLAGERVRSVLKDWCTRGVHAPGGRWHQTNFRVMLKSARLCGCRDYDGKLVPGDWPPIISQNETRRLRQVLDRNQRLPSARRYLLAGLVVCEKCGEKMIGRARATGVRCYICAKQFDHPNCGGIARKAESVEQFVVDMALSALDGSDLQAFLRQAKDERSADLQALIERDEERLKEMSIMFAEREIDKAEWYAARHHLNKRLEQNRKAVSRANGHGRLAELAGSGRQVREQWPSRSLDWQRGVLAAVIDRVVIKPAPHAARAFYPDLVDIRWRW